MIDLHRPAMEIAALPDAPAPVHFVGIGGIGMSGLARILHAWGYRVSGSDAQASDQTEALAALGVVIDIGHGALHEAAAAALIVITAAVRETNPEVAAARAAGVPVVKRADLLGLLARERICVAVAGSHGKSTTSGMLVVALQQLGADPSYAVGATIGPSGTNAASGSGAAMVVEADEYDYSFLALHPQVAIITNLDYDHPDIFPDQDAYDRAFAAFASLVGADGTLIVAGDEPGCARMLSARPLSARIVTFGEAEGVDWRLLEDGPDWRVVGPSGISTRLTLAVPGRHNARNATAALAALDVLGFDKSRAADAIAHFTGVGRRFEIKGEVAGVTVVDDYAHHPREIAATIAAARRAYPGRRLWAVFQPHTYSRTKALLDDFAGALSTADRTVVLDIYAARETDTLDISSADLLAKLDPSAMSVADPAEAAETVAAHVRAGDVVLGLGAGTITQMGPELIDRLKARAAAKSPRRGHVETDHVPGHPELTIRRGSPLSLWTTWRVGGPADMLIRASTPNLLRAAIDWGHDAGFPITVIGGGSNLLVGDGGVRGLVILARTPGERAEHLVSSVDEGDHVTVRVGAQAPLSWVGRYAAERGWRGLDWGVGLPGTIGGATVNNAGAHGAELKDHLEHVVVYDAMDGIRSFGREWLDATYRMTRLKREQRPRSLAVIEAIFRLPKGDRASLITLADDHARFRKLTQPTGACAGSTFANPPDDFAGRFLDEAGLKGHRIGGAAFSSKHANWIINSDKASANDIRSLIAHARDVVRRKYGIDLRSEVEELGEP